MLKNRLVYLRKKKNKTQEEIAKIIGVTRPAYTAYEIGTRSPDYTILESLADYFDVSTDYLLGRSNNPDSVHHDDVFDPMAEINNLLKKYEIDHSGFFDIDKWKAMGPDEIRELESYFEFITSRAKEKNRESKE